MADRLVDLNTAELSGLIKEYEGYRENLEEEIDEIEDEIIDLYESEGKGIDAFITALSSLRDEYKSSLVEINELIDILDSFYDNITSLTSGEISSKLPQKNKKMHRSSNGTSSIDSKIKIDEEIITDELYPKLNELLDSYVLEPSWFQSWVDAKCLEYGCQSNTSLSASGYDYGMGTSSQESIDFRNKKTEHDSIKNRSEILKVKIESNISEIKELGDFVIDIFGELDTLESLAESIGIDEDDYRRYNHGTDNGIDYNFDLDNLEVGLKNLLSDETRFSVLLDEIGDGTLNEQINEAWIDAILNDDYNKLIAIYESIGDYPEYSEYILGRLQEIQYNTSVSISEAIEQDYESKGYENVGINSHLYVDAENLFLKSLQFSTFSDSLLDFNVNNEAFELKFTNFSTTEGYITGNANVVIPSNSQYDIPYLNYEFSVNQYSESISHEDIDNYAEMQDKNAALGILVGGVSFNAQVGVVTGGAGILSNVLELLDSSEYAEAYDQKYGYTLSTQINSELYTENHFATIYMDIVQKEFPDVYDFIIEMNYNIEQYGHKEAAEMDMESKYDMKQILYDMNVAEGYALSIVSDMEGR